ncbi:DUF4259 domain-containing protein [Microbacterium enclense]|uniref:DUF4259 domain-containing protein n=1 Tax=Microbacterium enclense TaxID=993073 RepID=UPI0021A80765|nr:DUF4259 domain-containing protein [Microbacterium enclense]MCT2084785.1 DUF4259 domain-containing protein [Microbacterium enclense]
MGTWSGEPFGNDTAADFAWELDGQKRWSVVRGALRTALRSKDPLDMDTACVAIAAAEVVAHGLGRPTQSDVYTESVEEFVCRARRPSGRLVTAAERAVAAASAPGSELADGWMDDHEQEWRAANARLLVALRGE